MSRSPTIRLTFRPRLSLPPAAATSSTQPASARVNFNSSGDIRFGGSPPLIDGTQVAGTVKTPGDLNITAAQIYPLSGQSSVLYAGLVLLPNGSGGVQNGDSMDATKTITIRGNGGLLPEQPASAFGNLSLFAGTIDQGGVVRAPLGIIGFNSLPPGSTAAAIEASTEKVIFRSGSVTSASANGLIMPFGGTSRWHHLSGC